MDLVETKHHEQTLAHYLASLSQTLERDGPGWSWIRAEVSSVHTRGKGYVTVGLIEIDKIGTKIADTTALIWSKQVDSVVGRFKRETGLPLAAGMKILVHVSASISPVWGFRLTINDIDPSWTMGESQRNIQKIREDLADIWTFNQSLPRPSDLNRVMVIAPNGAGVEDFMREASIAQRWGICSFDVKYCTFEGPLAESSISSAFLSIKDQQTYDAIFLVRGGGATSALAWLDHPNIIKSICLCGIPVIVGVGHERDHHLVDEVAFVSVGTPSKAAGWMWRFWRDLLEAAQSWWQEAQVCVGRACDLRQSEIDSIVSGAHQTAYYLLEQAQKQVDFLAREGVGLGPDAVLKRGYSLVLEESGAVVKDYSALKADQTVWLMFENGSVAASIIENTALPVNSD